MINVVNAKVCTLNMFKKYLLEDDYETTYIFSGRLD